MGRLGLTAALLVLWRALPAAQPLPQFSLTGLEGWDEKVFEGRTAYSLADDAAQPVVAARCDHSASGLYFEQALDLKATPRLRWRWRVHAGVQPGIDHRRKAGDDALARVYVVARTGPFPWQARALNYVWAHNTSAGSDWPSPYTSKNHQVAVNAGKAGLGQWQTHTRDVREDFRRHFGLEVDTAAAVAVMTDCDDTGSRARADYGDIRLLPAE